MSKYLPEITKKIRSEDLFIIFEQRYSEITPVWMPMQMEWLNNVYRTFYDYEKFMIVMHLLSNTLDFYSRNFIKLDYEEYFNQSKIEIEKLNIIEISKSLNVPKETTRRKLNELEKLGTIKKSIKKIIIDRNTWPNIKPEDTIQRVSRFLSYLSNILYEEKITSEIITTNELVRVIKENFSFVWKIYYEMQIPMLLSFKEIHENLECFHVWGTCIVNQALNSKKNDNSKMNKDSYLNKYLFNSDERHVGINAMSISDITGIPRATVTRKLNKLIKQKFLSVNIKKQYLTTSEHKKKLIEIQKNNFINLSDFAARIYNLNLIKNK